MSWKARRAMTRLKHRWLQALVVLALWAGLVLPAASRADAPQKIAAIDIRLAQPKAGGFDWTALARALIDLHAGEVLTPEKLTRARKALSPFSRIQTALTPTGKGVWVVFTLQPFKLIKSIAIDGSYPLFEQDVRNVMTIAPGDFFRPQAVRAQEPLIVRRYKAEGYIDPKVRITWRQDPADGNYLLHIFIDKGPYYTLDKIRLSGNHAYGDDFLKDMMRSLLWAGTGRFVERRVKSDVARLIAFYRKAGYADVAISHTTNYDPGRRKAVVEVAVNEGPHYIISFTGRKYFSEHTLRKDLVLFEAGNRGNVGLRRSIQNIRRRYLQAGFAAVKVRWHVLTPAGNARNQRPIQIEIQEDGRHIVKRVVIEGNAHIDTQTIRGQMLTRPAGGTGNGAYVAEVLQEDMEAVRALYVKNGFLDARVNDQVAINSQDKTVSLTIRIEEGAQTLVGRVTIGGQVPKGVKDLSEALQLKPGEPFRPYMVQSDENELTARIAPLGYPYVEARAAVSYAADRTRADIAYQIDPGPFVRVGRIFYFGNFRTRRKTLDRELGLTQGAPFSLKQAFQAQRNLRDLDLFESVQLRPIGLKERASTVHLLFDLVEKKPYFFETGAGYQTDKGPYVRAKIGDHNFRGADMDIWTGGELSDVGYRWEAGISDPWLVGTRIRTDLNIYAQRQELYNQDFGTDTYGSTLTFSRHWGRFVTTGLALKYEQRDQFLRRHDASADVDPQTLEPRSILVTTPSINFDDRDSFIRPRRGLFAGFSVDISAGLENSLDNFLRYKLDLRAFHSPATSLTLAGRVQVGYLTSYGKNAELPEDQLFFLGGTTNVRGYAENKLRFDSDGDPLGGRLAINGSLEGRYDLGHNLEMILFVDAGTLQETLTQSDNDEVRWSVGLGLNYITPIGPIGIAYGLKIDPRPGESNGQFHFTIGYTF